ncbi:MAG TPA: hypothetical protein PKZ41_01500, partial [Candidatus Omnitrophota bacterium]|nr:hypothetical protein [Candidatus Omnitrophota bacterium]
SEDIVVEGDVYWNRSRNAVSIDMAFSVSPELAAGAGSGIKERLLTSKEDGWFGTSIAYKGNPDFLKALYTAISPSGDR